MSAWVYRCTDCQKTFTEEFEPDQTVPDTATCPFCEGEAEKVFELPDVSGGCECGGGSCCG